MVMVEVMMMMLFLFGFILYFCLEHTLTFFSCMAFYMHACFLDAL